MGQILIFDGSLPLFVSGSRQHNEYGISLHAEITPSDNQSLFTIPWSAKSTTDFRVERRREIWEQFSDSEHGPPSTHSQRHIASVCLSFPSIERRIKESIHLASRDSCKTDLIFQQRRLKTFSIVHLTPECIWHISATMHCVRERISPSTAIL